MVYILIDIIFVKIDNVKKNKKNFEMIFVCMFLSL